MEFARRAPQSVRFLVLAACMLQAVGVAFAHDVKDPVCRMTVDSDTAGYHRKLGGKTFFFCSRACQSKFALAPEQYVALAAQLLRSSGQDYTVLFESSPAEAGKPVSMEFRIVYADRRQPVVGLEKIHEKLLHLLMVREDLAWFEHQHPIQGKDGVFRLSWTFPCAGHYTLYADFTPIDGDNQVKPLHLTVAGPPAKTITLKPDRRRLCSVGDYRVMLRCSPSPLRRERATLLTYTFLDREGHPIRDMQPFIGAPGHLIAISQDRKQLIHTHTLHAPFEPSAGHTGLRVTAQMVHPQGPTFAFKLTLPSGGLYKTWAQFMRRNRVVTVSYTFRVQELWQASGRRPVRKNDRARTLLAARDR